MDYRWRSPNAQESEVGAHEGVKSYPSLVTISLRRRRGRGFRRRWRLPTAEALGKTKATTRGLVWKLGFLEGMTFEELISKVGSASLYTRGYG